MGSRSPARSSGYAERIDEDHVGIIFSVEQGPLLGDGEVVLRLDNLKGWRLERVPEPGEVVEAWHDE